MGLNSKETFLLRHEGLSSTSPGHASLVSKAGQQGKGVWGPRMRSQAEKSGRIEGKMSTKPRNAWKPLLITHPAPDSPPTLQRGHDQKKYPEHEYCNWFIFRTNDQVDSNLPTFSYPPRSASSAGARKASTARDQATR